MPIPATKYIWFNGKLVPWEKATVHVLSHALHYGSSVFEGVRAYETPRGPAIFRLKDHTRRLFDSAKVYRINIPFSEEQLSHAQREVIAQNGLARGAYLRPVAFRGYGEIGVVPKIDPPVDVAVAAWEWGKYLGAAEEEGVDVCVSSWQRVAPNTIPAMAKAGGNYLSSQLIGLEAKRLGFVEGIGLSTDGTVSEGAGENLFLIKDGVLYTPGVAHSLLNGITRHTVMTLAKDQGIEVREIAIPREMLYLADELFFTGTATEVAAIRSVDAIQIGNGKRGPITAKLANAYFALVQGRSDDKRGWLDYVDMNAPRAAVAKRIKMPKTMFEKVWDDHVVVPETADTPAVLFIDLHLTHEVTTPQAYTELRSRGLKLRRPDLTLATMDHSTPTRTEQVFGGVPIAVDSAARQVRQLEINAQEFGVELFNLQDSRRGIVHIIGPELGITQPGKTIVCGDSHTSTHGAFGALAFGIGTTEVGHVLATQCLLQRRPKTFAINVAGKLPAGVTAKDLILAIIGKIGMSGGTGYVLEYRGPAIEAMSMDERMTICNMSIEAGARAGMIAPDATTFEYLERTPRAPKGAAWEQALARWAKLPSDPGAVFDRSVEIDAPALVPMVTYGTHPGMVAPVNGHVPATGDAVFEKALKYMGLAAGQIISEVPVQNVFVGSCTNGRLSDLRNAARVLRGHKLAAGVKMLVVPGSQGVKRAAEAEGLHKVFLSAGAEWRESGCSMCLGMNGDLVPSGHYSISTSNRNFEGRQGQGARTLLASPETAAASAIRGRVTDPENL